MTKSELIKALEQVPDDAVLYTSDAEYNRYFVVQSIQTKVVTYKHGELCDYFMSPGSETREVWVIE